MKEVHPYMFIALGILLIGGGVLVWQKKQIVPQPKQETQTVEQPIQTDEVESVKDLVDGEYTFTPIDTSDWQTYRNEDAGFEVKYPGSWRAAERGGDNGDPSVVSLVSPETQQSVQNHRVGYTCDISIYYYASILDEPENNMKATTIESMIAQNEMVTRIGETKLGGIHALGVIWGGNGAYYSILAVRNNHLYKVWSCNKDSEAKFSQTEKQVIMSFKFMK